MAEPTLTVDVTGRRVSASTEGSWERRSEYDLHLDERLEEVVKVLDQLLRDGKHGDDRGVRLLGTILYEALFDGAIKQQFEAMWAAARPEAPMVLRLRIDDDRIDNLPWEHLYCPVGGGAHLASNRSLLFSRFHPTQLEAPARTVTRRELVVLFAIALADEMLQGILSELAIEGESTQLKTRAQRMARWDVDPFDEILLKRQGQDSSLTLGELREFIGHAVQERDDGLHPLVVPHPVGFAALSSEIPACRPDVVHFVGHGSLAPDGPWLAFVNPDGNVDWRKGSEFVNLFSEHQPALVVLHLCQGALPTFVASFRQLAPRLLDAGVDAVVAMQYPVKSDKAQAFVTQFYRSLTAGESVERSVQYGRHEVHKRTQFEQGAHQRFYRDYAAPILYTRHSSTVTLLEPDEDLPEEPPRKDARPHVQYATTPAAGSLQRAAQSDVSKDRVVSGGGAFTHRGPS